MATTETPAEILDNMLGYLGFITEVREEGEPGEPCLQVYTREAKSLVGKKGERLDDIQYLLNRVLQMAAPESPRVRVDVEHYRLMQEDAFLEGVHQLANRVRTSGCTVDLNPMNAYFRRLVHRTFADDPDVLTRSAHGGARMKKITLVPRKKAARGSTEGN